MAQLEAIRGYIALTDPDWYEFLCAQPRVDEVNFWQPHGGHAFRALEPGEMFFFKLRAPHKAVAGFGFFARYESLPAWLAWDCFGQMNGAPDFESMIEQIGRLRANNARVDPTGGFEIGCIMLSAPVFFPERDWVDPPADWARSGIQKGKTYDLRHGEGRRVRDACMQRAATGDRHWNVEPSGQLLVDGPERYGSLTSVRPRLGQGLFSLAVREAYNGACAVTHEHSGPVLEAAHIRPYAQGGLHRVDNGLLLRRDLHRLYDLGYVTVTPDSVFRVGNRLRDEFSNGRSYYGLGGAEISLPDRAPLRPSRELLDWHAREVFKG